MENLSLGLKEKISAIPGKPGIYKMYDINGELLYIGKSKFLKSRVKSYFYGNHKQTKTNILVKNIKDIKIIVTDTHLEAQILECALIKKLKPLYNSQFKNHNKYFYLKVEMESRFSNPLSIVYENKDEYTIGPFKNRRRIRELIQLMENIYPISLYNNDYSFEYSLIPRSLKEEDFKANQSNVLQILSNTEYGNLFMEANRKKMNLASSNLDFNTAIIYRDIIETIKYIHNVKSDYNNFNSKCILMGESIDYGYKLFLIQDNLIINKKKYSQINEENIIDFIERGKELNSRNLISNEKRNLDFKGIVYKELKCKLTKHITFIDHNFIVQEFIESLLNLKIVE